MRVKICTFFYILLSTVLLQVAQVNCSSNTGRKLNCFPSILKYENFNVDFYFSSRNVSNQLYDSDASLENGKIDFDPRRRTTVLVHGFMGTGQDTYMQSLTDSLIKWQDSNVINVEWREGCSNILTYFQAAVNTEYVAIRIRRLFRTFMKKWKNSAKSVEHWGPTHFIGHSIGAHAVGQAADLLLKGRNNLTVDRVTGLDPAGPCFDNSDSPLRLKSTDAKFVDVVHTDASTTSQQKFGLRDAIGRVDFYVNGGSEQPGCDKRRRKRASDIIGLVTHTLANGVCHHNRALELFTETVKQASPNGCQFWARPWRLDSKLAETRQILRGPCTSCIEMGINAENYHLTSKTYYVPTTGNPPYCRIKRKQ